MGAVATLRVVINGDVFDPDVFDPDVFDIGEDVTDDTVAALGMRIAYGIPGRGPLDLIAQTGTLEIWFDNAPRPDGRLRGRHSPRHANCREGWGRGAPIYVALTHDGVERRKFTGKLHVIDPDAGEFASQKVRVLAVDAIHDFVETTVRDLDVQVNQTDQALINAALDALPLDKQPLVRELDPALDTFPYAFDNIGSGVKCVSLLTAVSRSGGLMMIAAKGDGTVFTKNRQSLATVESAFTFANSMNELRAPTKATNVYDVARATIHKKVIDPTPIWVLYALKGTPPAIAPNQTLEFFADFRDPEDEQVRIAGLDVVLPLAPHTDFAANAAADGSGTDLTSSIQTTGTFAWGTRIKFRLTNTAPQTAYLVTGAGATLCQVRGKRVRDLNPQLFEVPASATGRAIELDMTYQAKDTIGRSLASYLFNQWSTDNEIEDFGFLANRSDELMQQALDREPGDCITVSETQTGLSLVDAIIRSVELTIRPGPLVFCRWGLTPTTVVRFWVWGLPGRSEWGETTIYAF